MNGAETVDHLVFGNNHGMRVIAGSIDDPSVVSKWESWLSGLVRLETFQGHQPPPTALSYLALDEGRVAVVRRSDDEAGALARGQAHVLIGPAAWLTPTVALGLRTWSRWNMSVNPGQPLKAISMSDIVEESNRVGAHLQEQAVIRGRMLKPVLAALAARPGERIVVLGCVDDDILPVLWGLHRIAGTTFTNPEDWTFSSYEPKRLDARGAPRIVFLPERPQAYTTRTQVDVQDDKPADLDPRVVNWVNTSVDDFARRTDDAFAPPPSVAAGEQATQRIPTPLPAYSGEASGGLSEAGGGRSTINVVPMHAQTGGGSTEWPDAVRDVPALPTYRDPGSTERRGPHGPAPGDRSPLVNQLMQVADLSELRAVLEPWSRASFAERRMHIRADELVEVFEHLGPRLTAEDQKVLASELAGAVLGRHCTEVRTDNGFAYVEQILRITAADSSRAQPLVRRVVKDARGEFGGMRQMGPVLVDAHLELLGLPVQSPARGQKRSDGAGEEPRPSVMGSFRLWGRREDSPKDSGGPRPFGRPGPVGMLLVGLGVVAIIVLVVLLFAGFFTTTAGPDTAPDPAATTEPETQPQTTTDAEQPDETTPPPLPSSTTVPAGEVGDDEVAYILYRGNGNVLYVGPLCTEEGDLYRCVPEGVPSELEQPVVVQVAASTPEVREENEGEAIGPGLFGGSGLPRGMTILVDTEEP